jgi:putative ABC transport system permease protein
MPEGLARRLGEACPGARVVPIRFRYLDWERAGRPSRVLLLALDAATFAAANRDRTPPLPGLELYGRLGEPGTALVSENFAALYGVRPGDALTLPGAEGPVALHVLGTVPDYSCNRGTVIVDRRQYRGQWDGHLADAFDLYLPPGTDPEEARRRLRRSAPDTENALCLLTHDEVGDHILGMVRGLYGLAYAQEAVVALTSILGMVTALLLSVLQRRRELGLLRAVGATPVQVLRSVLAEAVFLGALGTAAGLLAGMVLEWYTVRMILFRETGLLFPVQFPWAAVGAIVVLAPAGAVLAGLAPALRAARERIAEVVGCE